MRFPAEMKSYLKWGLMMLLPLYLIDQITKWIILTRMQIGDSISVIPNYFEIVHVRNTGVAFGLLQDIPDSYRLAFFLTVTVVAIIAIFVIFKQSNDDSLLLKAILCLILAGAIGNLTDRIVHNEVVDFINVHAFTYRWPTFNVADMYISIGMVGLLIYTFFVTEKKGQKDTVTG
jgi:signal peptidase II